MFKELRQLVSVILLSFILITFANTVFADAYSDCINQANQNVKTQCESFESELISNCSKNKTTESQCLQDVQTQIDNCIKNQSPIYLKPCEDLKKQSQTSNSSTCGNGKRDKGEECDDDNTISGDGCDSTCMIEDVVPPSIPQISTLPGPEAANVSTVSPYLMSTFLPRVAKTVISFAIGSAVLGLILSSIGLLTAYGNEEKYGNAKKGLIFSLIGLVIALLAFAIVQLVFFTGFQIGNVT